MVVRSSEHIFDFGGGENQLTGLVTSDVAPQGAGTMSQFTLPVTSNEGKDRGSKNMLTHYRTRPND